MTKRILVVFAMLLALVAIPSVSRPVTASPQGDQMLIDDPNFCYEGWTFTRQSSYVGGGCTRYDDTDRCGSTGVTFTNCGIYCLDSSLIRPCY